MARIEYAPNPTEILSNFKQEKDKKILTGRLYGTFKSAFPAGPPKMHSNVSDLPHLHWIEPSAVIIVSDADFLSDEVWLEDKN